MNQYFLLLFITLTSNTAANLLIKKGAVKLTPPEANLSSIFNFVGQVASNFFVVAGLTLFASGFFLWVLVLSKIQVSIAAPIMSLSYVLIAFSAYYFFKEPLTAPKLIGIAIIMFGVYIITR